MTYQNSRANSKKKQPQMWLFFLGTPDRIRTYGLRLRKPTLYPAELRVLVDVHSEFSLPNKFESWHSFVTSPLESSNSASAWFKASGRAGGSGKCKSQQLGDCSIILQR